MHTLDYFIESTSENVKNLNWLYEKPLRFTVLFECLRRSKLEKNNEFTISEVEFKSFGLKRTQKNKLSRIIKSLIEYEFIERTDKTNNNNQHYYRVMNTVKQSKKEDESFTKFWNAYPNKKSKKKARVTWSRISIKNHTKIFESLKNHKNSIQWKKKNGEFIPHPTTWLNGERWDDDIKSHSRILKLS